MQPRRQKTELSKVTTWAEWTLVCTPVLWLKDDTCLPTLPVTRDTMTLNLRLSHTRFIQKSITSNPYHEQRLLGNWHKNSLRLYNWILTQLASFLIPSHQNICIEKLTTQPVTYNVFFNVKWIHFQHWSTDSTSCPKEEGNLLTIKWKDPERHSPWNLAARCSQMSIPRTG